MMLKLACLALTVAIVAAQLNSQMMNMMLMQSLMNPSGGRGTSSAAAGAAGAAAAAGPTGAGTPLPGLGGSTAATGNSLMGGSGSAGRSSGMGGMMGNMLNNPLLLCRQTENFQPIPCQNWRNICNIVSMRTYNFPNLMSCSPMGIGCCIKDAMSLMFIQRLG